MENDFEDFDWTSFYDFAEDFHPSFRKELSKQLLQKISLKTKCKQFEKYNFQILIGLDDLHMQIHNNKMYALVSLITPVSLSIPTWIYWYSEDISYTLSDLHRQDISNVSVVIEWNIDFPLEEVVSYMRPRKIDKAKKTGYNFNIEFYYFSFPDFSLEFQFQQPLKDSEIDRINRFIADFQNEWNNLHADKIINYMSQLELVDDKTYLVTTDFGLKNNSKTLTEFFKSYNNSFQELTTSRICVK